MSKTLYLITFLSVLLLKSETSFSQDLKKELGICGKSFNAIFQVEKNKDPVFTTAITKDEEFCDNGRYEEGANFIIMLYNAKNQIVYDKHIFLNPLTFSEAANEKGEFIETKISDGQNSRIVKFPLTKEMGTFVSYTVKSIKTKKLYEFKKFPVVIK